MVPGGQRLLDGLGVVLPEPGGSPVNIISVQIFSNVEYIVPGGQVFPPFTGGFGVEGLNEPGGNPVNIMSVHLFNNVE